jgi:hypothetical protein
VKPPERRLGEVSQAYEVKADEYETVCKDLAAAESAYVKAKAVFKVEARYKAGADSKVSDVELETRAQADDKISELYEKFLGLKYAEKSLEQKLRQLKTQNDNGRTLVVNEREVDKIHAHGWSGAA